MIIIQSHPHDPHINFSSLSAICACFHLPLEKSMLIKVTTNIKNVDHGGGVGSLLLSLFSSLSSLSLTFSSLLPLLFI